MGWIAVWASSAGVLGLVCIGCSSPCPEVADLLRECCVKGPAELRPSCLAEAQRLEDDGDSEACQAALDERKYEGCRR